MFTGIVETVGEIAALERQHGSLRLAIKAPFTDVKIGESICVDGVCLTATAFRAGAFHCDVSSETLALTLAGHYRVGSRVNLERALRLSDRLGGHWLTGHVEQTCTVRKRVETSDFVELYFDGILQPGMGYIVKKGSIAVNGVSLTVNEVLPSGFQVMLVPHTLAQTNLSALREGDRVNLEFDWMTKVLINESQRLHSLTRMSRKPGE